MNTVHDLGLLTMAMSPTFCTASRRISVERYSECWTSVLYPGTQCTINLANSVTVSVAGGWAKGTYWLSSAVCIVMVSL